MLARALRARLGDDHVFLDVDSLTPGIAFPEKLAATLRQVDAVLVIIGSRWLDLLISASDLERDWVRFEVAASLRQPGLPVVPVCSIGVRFPSSDDLPAEIRDLAWRDGISLDPFTGFESGVERLLAGLARSMHSHDDLKKAPIGRFATFGSDGFLSIAAIRETVRLSGHMRFGEVPVSELLIFQTATQQTWVVASQHQMLILLDDSSTRQNDMIVQALFPKADALPLEFDGGGNLLRFSAQATWWNYSPHLFSSHSQLTNAVGKLAA
jgi:hypothetical protein